MNAKFLPCLTALPLLLAGPALADVPRVAVDIAPVHALVAQVMAGIGDPDLVLPPGASPHGYAMRPSDARALQLADLVIWVGPELTPWLAGPLDSIAPDAARLALLEVEGIARLGFRDGASFAAHDHSEAAGAGEHADHGNHGDHADHADHDAHGDHGDHADHADHDDHAHDGIDPHAWLDPLNALIWLDAIASELSRIDPANAASYGANAALAAVDLETLHRDIAARMAALSGDFVVFHDAYHYFEARFGIEAAGAISLSDATDPGPARVAELRDLVADRGISCVFVEPQFNRGMVDAVFEGSGLRIDVIDPLGATLTVGPALYAEMIAAMATSFETCLGG